MPLRPQWGDVGNANRAVGPAKQRGSELERALGARGGLYGTWGTSGVLTLPHKGRGCHYGRNGAVGRAQTAQCESQSNGGVSLSGRSERGAVVWYLGLLTVA